MLKKLLTFSLMLSLFLTPTSIVQPIVVRELASVGQQQVVSRLTDKKALMLLDEIITEAPALRLAENRAMVQATAADLLWAHDEQRARSLFGEAVANIREMMNGVSVDDLQYESLLQQREELRQTVLEIVARHDAQLARLLLRTTLHPAQEPDAELHLELSLAAQIATNDPRQAAYFAEETLERGISGQLPDLVAQIQAKDQEAAANLANAIVAKLRLTRLAINEEAISVAFNLFRLSTESPTVPGNTATPVRLLNQQSLQTLAEMIASVAITASADNADLLLGLQPLLADIERFAPARAPLVRRKLAQLAKAKGKLDSTSLDATEESGADDDKLQAAAKAGREDETRQLLATLRTPEERVTVLIQLAKTMIEKNEKKHAVELLNEAHGLVNNRARNFSQLGAQLEVACALAPLDPARSFVIIELVIDQLNELANAAVVVDGFMIEEQLARNDELALKAVSNYMDALPDEDSEDFAFLTHTRFDDLKQVLNRFQRGELRIMTRLLLVRSVLTQQPVINS